MNSSKVKTQKTLSALIAVALAVVTLFQAGAANSNEVAADFISAEEATLLAEIDQLFIDEAAEMAIEEEIFFEEMEQTTEEVKVYNSNNELIGEGDPSVNPLLNKLVIQGDYLSNMGGTKYYRVAM